jgi:hypothetical protein
MNFAKVNWDATVNNNKKMGIVVIITPRQYITDATVVEATRTLRVDFCYRIGVSNGGTRSGCSLDGTCIKKGRKELV